MTTGEGLLTFDAKTGHRIGEFKNPSTDPLSVPAIGKGYALVANPRYLYAIDRQGKERWRYPFGKSQSQTEFTAVRRPIVAGNGTILVIGSDNYLHAVSPDGKRIGHVSIGPYGPGQPAIPIAVGFGALLIDTRPSSSEPPHLVAVELGAEFGVTRFSAALGIDVSGLLTDDAFGIAATSYVETTTRHGTTRIVLLDPKGRERERIERGRHEDLRAVGPHGELILTSRDPHSDAPPDLEIWSSGGFQAATSLPEQPVAIVTSGSTIGSIECAGRDAVMRRYDFRLRPLGSAAIAVRCPISAALDRRGTLLVLAPTSSPGPAGTPTVELARVSLKMAP